MATPSLDADALVDQAISFKAFLGLSQPKQGDKFFLVMGLTGAGKSTFVSNCTGHDVTIGHGLYSYTPGFNDTSRSDIETLEVLATYLGASYANGVRIHGIITLYPITNNRMAGSHLRSLTILKEICGFDSYSNLAIVTTMWPRPPTSKNKTILEDRELELLTNSDFFSDLVSKGARLFRDYDENHSPANSEQRIIDTLLRQLDHGKHTVLQLQREVVDKEKSLGETAAGIAAAEHLHQTRLEHENQLRILDAEIERTSSISEHEYSLQLQELKAEVDREIEETKCSGQALVKTMMDLHETETKALKQRIYNLQSQYEAEVQNKEMILQDVQESCAALQKEIVRLANSPQKQQIVARQTKSHQKALSKAQKDAEKIRRDRQKVQGYTKEIVGGVMNGIAAGAVASVMGGLMCIVM
ncbi:GTP binding domain protein [Fusarium sp. NRRL 52700]|nr:GTP binding domain protein [Fusarium sp. NRRL 52700]